MKINIIFTRTCFVSTSTALHPCHSENSCPPCAELTTKTCMGEHKLWKNVPCHQKDVSCGQNCSKPLVCGMHKCDKVCHKVIKLYLSVIKAIIILLYFFETTHINVKLLLVV